MPNQFCHNDKMYENNRDISNGFNTFFSEFVNNSSNKSTNISKHYFDNLPIQNSVFTFETVTESIVLNAINNLKNSNSCGFDLISNKMVKQVKHLIIKHLTILINQCLDTGVFPDNLKIAEIKPLFKKNEKHLFTNYRPISLLPSLSKIYKRVIYNQIVQYLSENNLISKHQYRITQQNMLLYISILIL